MVRSVPIVLALGVGLALVGCSGGDDRSDLGPAASAATASPAASTTTPVAAPTTTTVGADPFAIPEVIDAAYVNRVLAALYAVNGDVVRSVVTTRSVDVDVVAKFVAIYSEPQLSVQLKELERLAIGDNTKYRSPPGDRRIELVGIVRASSECLVADVRFDFSEVVVDVAPLDSGKIDRLGLVRLRSEMNRQGHNPTPWSIAHATVTTQDSTGSDECPRSQ